ncbi:MAG: hypothetical protein MK066_12820 [Crocinitomicaceae bacterium]|nr:hypothetical protein [Crocinitomicaceae bacterium]
MSDGISQIIGEVREKAISFHERYVAEQSKNERLQVELNASRIELEKQNALIESLNLTVSSLKQELETTKNHNVSASEGKMVSNDEIDELVKEIEYCIGQLKG